jgi:DEAD/DEAH box helicase domain-containing protein
MTAAEIASANKAQNPTAGGKRKRTAKPDTPPADARSSQDGEGQTPVPDGPSAKGKRAARKTKASLKKETSQIVECVMEWPDLFKSLEKTHRALNLVFTFCCTRKYLATTFETIKATVETHIKRSLSIEEVASIVALRPEGINFAYVDEIMLQLDARGAERDDTFKKGRSYRSQGPAHDASVGGLTGKEGIDEHYQREVGGPENREVLYFEFIDGDLKRQVQDKKTGEITKPNRKLREEDLRMPVFSQKQMTQLIERRNARFANAINAFLNECVENKLDPEIALKAKTEPFIPVPTPVVEDDEKAPSTLPETIPKVRAPIPEIVQELKDSQWYTGQIVPDGHRVFEQQEPVYGDLNFLLSQDLVNALYNTKGITQFFAHQAEALNGLYEGQNVVVATSTSSGKSLIYQLPIIYALERDPNSRAMYIFPTKALAQDQKRSLKEMMGFMPGMEETLVETFDGDTPMSDRNMIRDEARIIFTNPDMLHVTILPQEERWRTFLKNLKYIVGK